MVNKSMKIFLGIPLFVFLLSFSAFADVKVSAEGMYTDTKLTVNIYVDTTNTEVGEAAPLVSYGVKMSYLSDDISGPVVTKNETDWYFGTAASPLPTPNAVPDTSTDGEVVIIGGKIDESNPTEGVSGEKVLLASVIFDRVSTNIPDVTLGLGKGGSYSNFVTTSGDVLDGTERLEFLPAMMTPECTLIGDINGDKIVNMLDFYVIQANWGQTGDNIADLNDDDIVNMLDFYIIQANWGTSCP